VFVIFRAMAFLVALCAPALLLGCSGQQAQPYPTHVAFRPPEGFSGTGHLTPRTIYSIGVPPLHNVTSQAVHLRSVTLTQTSSALRPISYHAYSYRTSGGGIIAAYGDLAKNCPSKYVVQPVASVTVQPKADAASFIVVTLDPSRAGTYKLGPFRLLYTLGRSKQVLAQYISPGVTLLVHPGPVQSRYYKQFCAKAVEK
jgi:hypothetical protein